MQGSLERVAQALRRFQLEDDIVTLERRLGELAADGDRNGAEAVDLLASRLAHRRAELATLGD